MRAPFRQQNSILTLYITIFTDNRYHVRDFYLSFRTCFLSNVFVGVVLLESFHDFQQFASNCRFVLLFCMLVKESDSF